jgi:ribulose-bisphosphate carboxylase large chain
MISGERFSVIYRLISADEQEARQKAWGICLEQTVEFPEELVPAGMIRDDIVGRIEALAPISAGVYQAVISYAVETTANEFTQLLNVVFGNISIKPGIRVERLELPQALLSQYGGPRFGREGLRKLLGVSGRPLLFTALKPMGLSPAQLADMAYKCAMGGIDIIKDDHGLTNQVFAPFRERVTACVEAVEKANAQTGRQTIYVPNITAPANEVVARAKLAKTLGAKGVMLSPAITGLDVMKFLAEDAEFGLPVISHPAFQGSYVTSHNNGISHFALFGQITRLAGADVVIYPNFGGRFSFSREECQDIVSGTCVNMGQIKPIFPSPGGGMSLDRIGELMAVYGNEVIFLVGGGLFKHGPDLIENCRYFHDMVSNFSNTGGN